MTTEVIRSRRNLNIGDLVEDRVILEKNVVIPPDEKEKRQGVYDYTVEALPSQEEEKTPKKRGRKPKKADPGYTRIDMSTMTPVSGTPIVTFRRILGK